MSDRTFKSLVRYDGNLPDSWYNYRCGHCGHDVTGLVVARHNDPGRIETAIWLLCPNCGDASVVTKKEELYPAALPGPELMGLPADIGNAYLEARKCLGLLAFTACTMMCRKILLHVAVEKGAEAGKPFEFCVDYLQDQGYISHNMKPWVDRIRRLGNEGAHDLEAPSSEAAESALIFTGELLRTVYEMQVLNDRFGSQTA
jgi:ribosomal protein S27AE